MKKSTRDHIRVLANVIARRRGTAGGGYVVFTGAGASVKSGCPSGRDVIKAYLELLFAATPEDTRPAAFERTYDLPPTFEHIARVLINEHSEHGARDCLLHLFAKTKSTRGYACLCRLTKDRYFADTLFTTNWDRLLEEALPSSKAIVREADLRHTADATFRVHKLHGDFQTPESMLWDAAALSDWQQDALRVYFRSHTFLFLGYSVSDADVTEALLPAMSGSAPREAWIVSNSKTGATSRMQTFLERCGRPSNFINASFDDFMTELADTIYAVAPSIRASDKKRPHITGLSQTVYMSLGYGEEFSWDELRAENRSHYGTPDTPTQHASLTRYDCESQITYHYSAFFRFAGQPGATRKLDIIELVLRLERCVDLTDAETARAWLVKPSLFRAPESERDSNIQGISMRLRDAGVQALIVPSYVTPDGKEIIVFGDRVEADAVDVLARKSIELFYDGRHISEVRHLSGKML